MSIKTIFVLHSGEFSSFIIQWFQSIGIEVNHIDLKSDFSELVDGVVLFHADHTISKEMEEVVSSLDKNNRPGYKIDINGTLAATRSNFEMWLDRNRPESVLFLGSDDLAKNENLDRFFRSIVPAR